MAISPETIFNSVEEKKQLFDLPKSQFPVILNRVNNWREVELAPDQLRSLQYYIETGHRPLAPSGIIFSRIHSPYLGNLADSFEDLHEHTTPEVKTGLSQINEDLFHIVRTDCPPVFVLSHPMFVYGNIPDGNHRLLAAAILTRNGEKISVPAYQGELSDTDYFVLNMIHFLLRMRKNPSLTKQLALKRFNQSKTYSNPKYVPT